MLRLTLPGALDNLRETTQAGSRGSQALQSSNCGGPKLFYLPPHSFFTHFMKSKKVTEL